MTAHWFVHLTAVIQELVMVSALILMEQLRKHWFGKMTESRNTGLDFD